MTRKKPPTKAAIDRLLRTFGELSVEPTVIDEVGQQLKKNPDSEESWIEAAADLRQRDAFHAALATYDVALEAFPQSHILWGNRGILLRQWKRFDEAIASIQQALKLEPDYAFAMESLAMTYELKGDFKSAIEWYRAAIDGGRGGVAWNNMGNCYAALGDLDQAFACYQRALELAPEHIDTLFNWAAHLAELGRVSEAIEKIDAYLAKQPDDRDANKLREQLLTRPQQPLPVEPMRFPSPLVFRPLSNVDYDGTVTPPDMLYDKPLSMSEIAAMTREEAARVAGPRTWDMMHSWALVDEYVQAHEPPDHPRIFLAYRWESDEHTRWVTQLAEALDARGYDVMFDRFAAKETKAPTAPEMISRLAACRLFVLC